MIHLDPTCLKNVKNMQIHDIFHNCPEQQQEEQQQSDPKDLGSKFPRSKSYQKCLRL
jgi:hypothetical protein